MTSAGPLLLILEDLEWADPSSVELVHFLARRMTEILGVLLLSIDPDGSGGEGSANEAVQSLVTRSGAALLEPGSLTATEVEQATAVGGDMLVVAGAEAEEVAELVMAAAKALGRAEAGVTAPSTAATISATASSSSSSASRASARQVVNATARAIAAATRRRARPRSGRPLTSVAPTSSR
jgi:hypothetical protein